MVRIVLPKGTILKKSLQLASRIIGREVSSTNTLVGKNVEIYFAKHRDIPNLVQNGIMDVGMTSEEWLRENNSNLYILKKTNWCNTRISYIDKNNIRPSGSCVTEFPNIAQKFFSDKGINMKIYTVSGSAEMFVPYIFDCCIDCVETGSTLAENGLLEREVILESQVVVIAKKENIKDSSIWKRMENVLNDERN